MKKFFVSAFICAQATMSVAQAGGTDTGTIIEAKIGVRRDSNGVLTHVGVEGEVSRTAAWEVVRIYGDTFLNYSRFPYGDSPNDIVCYKAIGQTVYMGTGDSEIQLKKALAKVIVIDTGRSVKPNCQTFGNLVQSNPEAKGIKRFFNSVRGT